MEKSLETGNVITLDDHRELLLIEQQDDLFLAVGVSGDDEVVGPYCVVRGYFIGKDEYVNIEYESMDGSEVLRNWTDYLDVCKVSEDTDRDT